MNMAPDVIWRNTDWHLGTNQYLHWGRGVEEFKGKRKLLFQDEAGMQKFFLIMKGGGGHEIYMNKKQRVWEGNMLNFSQMLCFPAWETQHLCVKILHSPL